MNDNLKGAVRVENGVIDWLHFRQKLQVYKFSFYIIWIFIVYFYSVCICLQFDFYKRKRHFFERLNLVIFGKFSQKLEVRMHEQLIVSLNEFWLSVFARIF